MQMTGLFYIILAVIADVIANVCLKKSNGFANKKYGFASLALIGVAFLLMAQHRLRRLGRFGHTFNHLRG